MAERANKLKNAPAEAAPTPKVPKSSPKKEVEKPLFSGIFRFFKDELTLKLSGLILVFFSIFSLLSFISYPFSWEEDYSEVTQPWLSFLSNHYNASNILGKLGALLSHVFMYNGFGISSIGICFISFLIGFRLIFQFSIFSLLKSIAYTLFLLVFISCCLGFAGNVGYLGGSIGFQTSMALSELFGKAGSAVLLSFVLLGFVIIAFKPAWNLAAWLESRNARVSEEEISAPVTSAKAAPIIMDDEDGLDRNDPIAEYRNTLRNEAAAKPVLEVNLPEEEEEDADEEEDYDEDEIEPILQSSIPIATTNRINEPLSDKLQQLAPEGPYDPTLELANFKFPHLDLLENHGSSKVQVDREELDANKDKIISTLGEFGIEIEKIKATIGPTVTLYEIVPQAGVRISKIQNLEDDIALRLSAKGIRIIAPMPGRGTIGIEVPNQKPELVSMRSVLAAEKFQNSDMELPIGLGKTISNEVFVFDLAKMPHLLVAGATGQGKSVGINAILLSLLYKKHPSQLKFVLVDPKKVELTLYQAIERHYLAMLPGEEEPIITDTKKVIHTLNSLCSEMDIRYDLLKNAQVRNIKEYNTKFTARKLNPNNGHRFLPYIVLVIDEFADFIMTAGKEVEMPIARLAQMARAVGIHLIIATQRPSVNIITGTIKANFPARIAFTVRAKVDSRTILDAGGADQLIGRGDMLITSGADLVRLQCAFVDTPEVEAVMNYISEQTGYMSPYYLPEYIDEKEAGNASVSLQDKDSMFDEAARIIVQHQQGSTSLLQRRLNLGYNRAGRLIDQLAAAGIVGASNGSKAREVLIHTENDLQELLNKL